MEHCLGKGGFIGLISVQLYVLVSVQLYVLVSV